MQITDIRGMFQFSYVKSSMAICSKIKAKVTALQEKANERSARISRTREENKITDEVMINILAKANHQTKVQQGTHQFTNMVRSGDGKMREEEVLVPAGVVNNLLAEMQFLENERAQIETLLVIARNLEDLPDVHSGTGHRLSLEELRFLGF